MCDRESTYRSTALIWDWVWAEVERFAQFVSQLLLSALTEVMPDTTITTATVYVWRCVRELILLPLLMQKQHMQCIYCTVLSSEVSRQICDLVCAWVITFLPADMAQKDSLKSRCWSPIYFTGRFVQIITVGCDLEAGSSQEVLPGQTLLSFACRELRNTWETWLCLFFTTQFAADWLTLQYT